MTDVTDTPSPETRAADEKITTTPNEPKIKDPKKVAQGKKLAAISKQAKERKLQERLKAEKMEDSWNLPWGYIIGTIGLATAAGSLYYGYSKNEPNFTVTPTPEPVQTHTTGNLESLD